MTASRFLSTALFIAATGLLTAAEPTKPAVATTLGEATELNQLSLTGKNAHAPTGGNPGYRWISPIEPSIPLRA